MGHGLTRARTMGPVAEAVSVAGGSPTRVFGRARIPLALLDTPDRLILLRDQLTLIDAAVREIADPSLPARLSTHTGLAGLGPIGVQVRAAATLGEALARVEVVTPLLLQTATWTGVRLNGTNAFYGYAVAERVASGRQANEILALGYLLGTVRHFLGATWRPSQAVVTGAHLPGRAEIEALFGSELVLGSRAGLVFPAHYLDAPNPRRHDPIGSDAALDEPISDDLAACVAHLIALDLDEARPSIDGIARRLGLSRRTLQRRLDDAGTCYIDIQQRVMARRAKSLLAEDRLSIGRIALELGYAEASHFTRAFLEWTGITPSRWRRGVRSVAKD